LCDSIVSVLIRLILSPGYISLHFPSYVAACFRTHVDRFHEF
jgi:hypothetical protein